MHLMRGAAGIIAGPQHLIERGVINLTFDDIDFFHIGMRFSTILSRVGPRQKARQTRIVTGLRGLSPGSQTAPCHPFLAVLPNDQHVQLLKGSIRALGVFAISECLYTQLH